MADVVDESPKGGKEPKGKGKGRKGIGGKSGFPKVRCLFNIPVQLKKLVFFENLNSFELCQFCNLGFA
jgi:hypothetical protein